MAGGNLAPSARLFTCAGAEMQNNILAQEQGPLIHKENRENPVLPHVKRGSPLYKLFGAGWGQKGVGGFFLKIRPHSCV